MTSVPPELECLVGLLELDLSHNRVTQLAAEVGHLENLAVLDLSCNQLTEVPGELARLENLVRLDLRGNPLPASDELLEQTHEPMELLRHLIPQEVEGR